MNQGYCFLTTIAVSVFTFSQISSFGNRAQPRRT